MENRALKNRIKMIYYSHSDALLTLRFNDEFLKRYKNKETLERYIKRYLKATCKVYIFFEGKKPNEYKAIVMLKKYNADCVLWKKMTKGSYIRVESHNGSIKKYYNQVKNKDRIIYSRNYQ